MGAVPLIRFLCFHLGLSLLSLLLCDSDMVMAQSGESNQKSEEAMPLNLKLKTMGGRQFWTDVIHISDWRIQRNAMTGHHRLIDPDDIRHGWGTLQQCRQILDERVRKGSIAPNSGKVVLVLHGLMRSSQSMEPMVQHLREEGGYQLINIQYASSRNVVARHASDLAGLISNLGPDVTEINFVAHSMGNIVVRHYLKDLEVRGDAVDDRFHRMVMIGPPNQGSKMAHVLRNSILFKSLAGLPGSQLGEKWSDLQPHLATPGFEFGIIAGGQTDKQKLNNFVLNGPDDFTVALEETRLAGAQDWLIRPLVHTTMMKNELTLQSTLRFLQHGFFVSSDDMNPILVSASEVDR